MYILGINGFFHDTSAALMKDGKLIAFVEEERLIRQKHSFGIFPDKSIEYCLRVAGIDYTDIDAIVCEHQIDVTLKQDSKLQPFATLFKDYPDVAQRHYNIFNSAKNKFLSFASSKRIRKAVFAPHHETHLATAYYGSGFDKALVLSIDGRGETQSTAIALGRNGAIEMLDQAPLPVSLGMFYGSVTSYLGYRAFDGEGTVMGLAAFGEDVYRDFFDELVSRNGHRFSMRPEVAFNRLIEPLCSMIPSPLELAFGKPRSFSPDPRNGIDENIAASLQARVERAVEDYVRHYMQKTGAKKLCIAGGVGMNSKLNGHLLSRLGLEDMYAFPVAGDAGCAIGACMWYARQNGVERIDPIWNIYSGPDADEEEIALALGGCNVHKEKYPDMPGAVAEMIANHQIVGWFQGRMEGGPRALGSRSILSNPSSIKDKDKVNNKVKFREPWRPFAPSILHEAREAYMGSSIHAPFMSITFDTPVAVRDKIPAAMHVDGTIRAQTVKREDNPLYYDMIQRLGALTGTPVVTNTSFNRKGEPIVNSSYDAIEMFLATGMDALAIGSYLVRKKSHVTVPVGWPSRTQLLRNDVMAIRTENERLKLTIRNVEERMERQAHRFQRILAAETVAKENAMRIAENTNSDTSPVKDKSLPAPAPIGARMLGDTILTGWWKAFRMASGAPGEVRKFFWGINSRAPRNLMKDISRRYDEKLYLRRNSDVATLVKAGQFRTGRDHWDKVGLKESIKGKRITGFYDLDFQFDEKAYLKANVDVKRAVESGRMNSGYLHWRLHGYEEFKEGLRSPGFIDITHGPVSDDKARKRAARLTSILTDIIVFPIIEWDFRIQRGQHLIKELAQDNRVFYISQNFLYNPFSSPGYAIIKEVEKNVFLVNLNCPYPKRNIYMDKLSTEQIRCLVHSLAILREEMQIGRITSIIQFPSWRLVAEGIPGSQAIYDCMDHHQSFPNVSEHNQEEERALIDEADAFITSSNSLANTFAGLRNSVVIRNAAQVEHFMNAMRLSKPTSIRPTVGYFGAIAQWFDINLVIEAARCYPQWDFKLIGSCAGLQEETGRRLPKNILFAGEIPYDDLPVQLSWFDICIIPFRITPLIEHTDPVKVYEYLAAGKPVVATAMPELFRINDLVHVARNDEEFINALDTAMKEAGDRELAAKRMAWAKEQTWVARASQIRQIMEELCPKVSVIVLTYNNLALTKACLDSLIRFSHYPNMEIIVVDNASTDDSREYLLTFKETNPGVKVIFNDENLGFSGGNNIGLKEATGDYLVLLNNDTYVTEGWLYGLVRPLMRDKTIGLAGPVTNNIGNEAKLNIAYDSMPQMARMAFEYTSSHPRELLSVSKVGFFCVATRRDVIEKVGYLDEDFKVGFFEDDDYCNRIHANGYRAVIVEDTFVHHHLSGSFDQLTAERKRQIFEKNKDVYESKWGAWVPHSYRDS